MQDKVRENRLRRWASRLGLAVHKSRARQYHFNDHGKYMLVDTAINGVVGGRDYDWTLEDIEWFLTDAEQRHKSGDYRVSPRTLPAPVMSWRP